MRRLVPAGIVAAVLLLIIIATVRRSRRSSLNSLTTIAHTPGLRKSTPIEIYVC